MHHLGGLSNRKTDLQCSQVSKELMSYVCVLLLVHIFFLSYSDTDALISLGMILLNERFAVFEEMGAQKGTTCSYPAYMYDFFYPSKV